jgi:hypothetical protein
LLTDVLFANAGIVNVVPLGSVTETHFDKYLLRDGAERCACRELHCCLSRLKEKFRHNILYEKDSKMARIKRNVLLSINQQVDRI